MANPDPLNRQHTLIGGKYRLGAEIGSGGVATVYRATHVWTEREVAVKILDPSLPHFEQLREGFLREARATVQLHHPNVVDVLDMGEEGGETVFLVMEYIDGPTLRDVLSEQGPLSNEDTLAILMPLIDALQKAHGLGIVHRDFKPENIMLSFDEEGVATPKLLDFGTAAVLRDTTTGRAPNPGDVIVGTPQYMSPEQAANQRASTGPQTDVWGVGVVWYECLTGRCPFEGESAEQIMQAVCNAPIDFDEIPAAFRPVLEGALQRSTELRTQTLVELRASIDAVDGVPSSSLSPSLSSSSTPPRASETLPTLHGLGPAESVRTSPPPLAPRPATRVELDLPDLPSRSHRNAAWGGVALAALLGFAAWWTIHEPDPPRPPQAEPAAVDREVDEAPTDAAPESPAAAQNPAPESPEVATQDDPALESPQTATQDDPEPGIATSSAVAPEVEDVKLEPELPSAGDPTASAEADPEPASAAPPAPTPKATPRAAAKAAPKAVTPKRRSPPRRQETTTSRGPRAGTRKVPELVTEW